METHPPKNPDRHTPRLWNLLAGRYLDDQQIREAFFSVYFLKLEQID